jgi:exosortase/archaeosortase family protein
MLRTPIVTFACLAAAVSLAYYFPYGESSVAATFLSAYLAAYAKAVGAVVMLFDSSVRVSDTDIVGRFGIRVSRDCDGMSAIIFFGSAVMAYPAKWIQRFVGIALGVLLIAFVNVVRLCSMYYIGARWPSAFDFAHLELWPLLLTGAVAGTFFAWRHWVGVEQAATRMAHTA